MMLRRGDIICDGAGETGVITKVDDIYVYMLWADGSTTAKTRDFAEDLFKMKNHPWKWCGSTPRVDALLEDLE